MKIIRDGVAESGVRSDYKLLSGLFFRLLPYQILLIVINAINGIVDSLFASNSIGQESMSAIGLFAPMTHFLYALNIMPLAVISLCFACYAQAIQKKAMSIVLPVIDGFAGVTCLSLFLLPAMKMNGLYLANILNGVICFAVITAFAWKAQGRCPRNVEELLAIPAGFEAPDTKRLDVTVRNMDDVVNISRQVMAFCGDLGADRRRTYLAGLSLEEMASNVVLHGFKKDKKKHHSVDIRVMYSEDTLLLRLRDDCRPFDPASRADLLNEEDITRNIGIRTVFQTAQSVQYQNLLGLNVLTIRI